MAAPIHPAIGRTYGAACDAWLLRPGSLEIDLLIPSKEVMQQFDSTILVWNGVDPAKFEALWAKRTAVQDKLRIEQLKARPFPKVWRFETTCATPKTFATLHFESAVASVCGAIECL